MPKRVRRNGDSRRGGGDTALPVVVDGIVYLRDGRRLYAIDRQDGQEVWSFTVPVRDSKMPGEGIALKSTVADGIVYFAERVSKSWSRLHVLDAKTGELRRIVKLRFSLPITVADDLVFVPSHDGYVYALEHPPARKD
jgi:outer membrane protein assembly factor BamB